MGSKYTLLSMMICAARGAREYKKCTECIPSRLNVIAALVKTPCACSDAAAIDSALMAKIVCDNDQNG
jgi:hypothetical protein